MRRGTKLPLVCGWLFMDISCSNSHQSLISSSDGNRCCWLELLLCQSLVVTLHKIQLVHYWASASTYWCTEMLWQGWFSSIHAIQLSRISIHMCVCKFLHGGHTGHRRAAPRAGVQILRLQPQCLKVFKQETDLRCPRRRDDDISKSSQIKTVLMCRVTADLTVFLYVRHEHLQNVTQLNVSMQEIWLLWFSRCFHREVNKMVSAETVVCDVFIIRLQPFVQVFPSLCPSSACVVGQIESRSH